MNENKLEKIYTKLMKRSREESQRFFRLVEARKTLFKKHNVDFISSKSLYPSGKNSELDIALSFLNANRSGLLTVQMMLHCVAKDLGKEVVSFDPNVLPLIEAFQKNEAYKKIDFSQKIIHHLKEIDFMDNKTQSYFVQSFIKHYPSSQEISDYKKSEFYKAYNLILKYGRETGLKVYRSNIKQTVPDNKIQYNKTQLPKIQKPEAATQPSQIKESFSTPISSSSSSNALFEKCYVNIRALGDSPEAILSKEYSAKDFLGEVYTDFRKNISYNSNVIEKTKKTFVIHPKIFQRSQGFVVKWENNRQHNMERQYFSVLGLLQNDMSSKVVKEQYVKSYIDMFATKSASDSNTSSISMQKIFNSEMGYMFKEAKSIIIFDFYDNTDLYVSEFGQPMTLVQPIANNKDYILGNRLLLPDDVLYIKKKNGSGQSLNHSQPAFTLTFLNDKQQILGGIAFK